MKTLRFRSWAAVGIIIALFLTGCGKKTPNPTNTTASQPIEYGPAPGQRLQHLLINETESKDYLGFRVHYTLTEPEYEPVTPLQVWQETQAKAWVNRDTFFSLEAQYVRLVRPIGSCGWKVGYFLQSYYKNTEPKTLFLATAGLLHLKNKIDQSSVQVVGKFVEDHPDEGRRTGRRLAALELDEHFITSYTVIDVASPEFENKLKAVIAAKQASMEVAKLPWMIQQVKPEKRAEGLAKLNELCAKAFQLVEGNREWQGVLVFPKANIPVTLIFDRITFDRKEPWSTQPSGNLKWKGMHGPFPASFNGGINTDEDSEFCFSSYLFNPGRLSSQATETTKKRMETDPLSLTTHDLNCFILRIIDQNQIEIRADGIPPTILTRSGAPIALLPAAGKIHQGASAQPAVGNTIPSENLPSPPVEKTDPVATLEAFRQKLYALRAKGDEGTRWQGTALFPNAQIPVQLKITYPAVLDPKKFLAAAAFCDFKVMQAKPYSKYLSGRVDVRSNAPFPHDSFVLNTGNTNDSLKPETIRRMDTNPLEQLDRDLRNLVIHVIDEDTIEIQADGVPLTQLVRLN